MAVDDALVAEAVAAFQAVIVRPHVVRTASDLVLLRDPPVGAAWLEEVLDGDDLSDLVGQPWSCVDAVRLGHQVSLGLAELHDRKVVHRDLSPNNIRCKADGQYVVMDPGYARHELLPAITIAGHPGTYGFISPEHLNALPSGPTAFSDVFCFIWRSPVRYRSHSQGMRRTMPGAFELPSITTWRTIARP